MEKECKVDDILNDYSFHIGVAEENLMSTTVLSYPKVKKEFPCYLLVIDKLRESVVNMINDCIDFTKKENKLPFYIKVGEHEVLKGYIEKTKIEEIKKMTKSEVIYQNEKGTEEVVDEKFNLMNSSIEF